MRADIQALETSENVVYCENEPQNSSNLNVKHRPMVSVEIIK